MSGPSCSSSLSIASNSFSDVSGDTGLVSRKANDTGTGGSLRVSAGAGDVAGVVRSSWMPGVEGVAGPSSSSGGGDEERPGGGGGGDGGLSENDFEETDEGDPGRGGNGERGDTDLLRLDFGEDVERCPPESCPLSRLSSSDERLPLQTCDMTSLTSRDPWRLERVRLLF